MNACYADFGSLLLFFLIQKVLPGAAFPFPSEGTVYTPGPATEVFNSQVYDP